MKNSEEKKQKVKLPIPLIIKKLNEYRFEFDTCTNFNVTSINKAIAICTNIEQDVDLIIFDDTKKPYVKIYLDRILNIKQTAIDFKKSFNYTPSIVQGQAATNYHPKPEIWYQDVIGSFESATDIFERELDGSAPRFIDEGGSPN